MTTHWKPGYERSEVELITQENVYSGHITVTNCQLKFKTFAGDWSVAIWREVIQRPAAVVVLPYDPNTDQVLLIEQIRYPIYDEGQNPWILEPIAGLIDPGESIENTARREAIEESGCELKNLYPINSYYPSPGISNEHTHAFLGIIDMPTASGLYGLQEEGEDIKTHILTADQTIDLLQQPMVWSATTLICLQWFALNRAKIKEKELIS